MAEITADRVIKAYMDTREEIARLNKEMEEKLQPLKTLQENREKWLMGAIQQSGLKNLPTKFGTAYVTRAESVTVADWDSYFEWVKTNERWDTIEKRASKTAVLEIMGEERQNPPPPGLNYSAVNKIGVRKS